MATCMAETIRFHINLREREAIDLPGKASWLRKACVRGFMLIEALIVIAIIGTLMIYVGTLDSPALGAGIMAIFALGVAIPFVLAALLMGRSSRLMASLAGWQRPIQYLTSLVVLFFGGLVSGPGWQPVLTGLLLWFALVAVTIVLRNTTPRVRTDQAVRFFWGPVSLLAAAAVTLAWMGW